MRPIAIDALTVDELKNLKREINREIREKKRLLEPKTENARFRSIDTGTRLGRKEWQVLIKERKFFDDTDGTNNKVIVRAETREQAIDGLKAWIAELTDLYELAKQEVIE